MRSDRRTNTVCSTHVRSPEESDQKGRRRVGARERRRGWGVSVDHHRVSVWEAEKVLGMDCRREGPTRGLNGNGKNTIKKLRKTVLEMDGGDGCMTL